MAGHQRREWQSLEGLVRCMETAGALNDTP
jgi:hypothetical protein